MKCGNCPALRTEGYEYPETYCLLGAETTREYADGWSGCYRKRASIEKQIAKVEDMIAHQYDGIEEHVKRQERKEKAMREAYRREIYEYRYGNRFLCYKDLDGTYHIAGDGLPTNEMIGMLQMTYDEELENLEREAYNEKVPPENKSPIPNKDSRRSNPFQKGGGDGE